ncbi:hypothetical protein GW846_05155 [Candidatus Gracilibacteria bacterium]|nr:hypothetical protein [Candidatus Gracilibacteria bacterium]
MKHTASKSGFSIVLALGLTVFFSFIGLYLLEYMIPYSRNVSGIENASNAFYQGYAGLEQGIYAHSLKTVTTYGNEINASGGDLNINYAYSSTSSGTIIPSTGQGDSEYDQNFNRISPDNVAQFLVGNNRISAPLTLRVQIPDLDGVGGLNEQFNTTQNDDILVWQLSSDTASLTTLSGSLITETQIQGGSSGYSFNIWPRTGTNLDGISNETFGSFYGSNCGSGSECVLTLSIVNPLVLINNQTQLSFLEYRLTSNGAIPLPATAIVSVGKSRGFAKKLEVQVPQLSTNSAFGFTIFQ